MTTSSNLLILLLASLCACDTSSDDSMRADGGPEADVDAQDVTSELACDTYSWCTTYGPNDDEIIDPPELTGGTIPDGLYRLEQGTFVTEAYAFEGNTVVSIGSQHSNQIGTYTTSGGTITINLARRCASDGEEASTSSYDYSYTVVGDDLFMRYGDSDVWRYRRASSLCQTSDDFDCWVSNCACVEMQGEGMGETTGNPLNQCGL